MEEYKFIIIPLFALFSAQIIKFILESFTKKKLIWGRLVNGCGGIPSTHTSFVFSLVGAIGFSGYVKQPIFAISLVFAMVVAYDAMGLRMQSEKQAETINMITEELLKGNRKKAYAHLKEEIGHNPFEVLVGIIYGLLVAYIGVSLF